MPIASCHDNHTNTLATIWLGFLASCFILGVAYVYFLNTSMFMAKATQQSGEMISDLEAKIAILETDYLKTVGEITLAKAVDKGFVDVSNSLAFAYRLGAKSGALTMSR